jgi:hypothetical protein
MAESKILLFYENGVGDYELHTLKLVLRTLVRCFSISGARATARRAD